MLIKERRTRAFRRAMARTVHSPLETRITTPPKRRIRLNTGQRTTTRFHRPTPREKTCIRAPNPNNRPKTSATENGTDPL